MQSPVTGLFFPDASKVGTAFIFKAWGSNTRNKKKKEKKKKKKKKEEEEEEKKKKKKKNVPSKHQITPIGNVKHSL